jgi:hypothetical protein
MHHHLIENLPELPSSKEWRACVAIEKLPIPNIAGHDTTIQNRTSSSDGQTTSLTP